MNVVDKKTTRKDINKYQTANTIHDQNSMTTVNKFVTKSNSHQIKTKQNILTCTSLEMI